MDKVTKIGLGTEARVIQKVIHKRGHWANSSNDGNSWIVYIVVIGISIVSFIFSIFLG